MAASLTRRLLLLKCIPYSTVLYSQSHYNLPSLHLVSSKRRANNERYTDKSLINWYSSNHGNTTRQFSNRFSSSSNVSDKIIHFIGWLGGFYGRKAVLTRSAKVIYENCIDDIDYETFMSACALPDTFQSWFLIAQLHIWLCLVRLKREGKDGRYLTHQLVTFFWKDVQDRMNVLGVTSGKVTNESLRELDKEFRGLIFAYEEGLLTDDRTLAGALWRNLIFDKSNTNLEILERLVKYVRQQVKEMDGTERDQLLSHGTMTILPLTLKGAS